MPIALHENCEAHLAEFIALNRRWIEEYFEWEDADRKLAADPAAVWRDGGWIFTATEDDAVVGCCALFNEGGGEFELARMAVDPAHQRRGIGLTLAEHAFAKLRAENATLVHLLTNTCLEPAVALYHKLGFEPAVEGPHPVYRRCNLVMERRV